MHVEARRGESAQQLTGFRSAIVRGVTGEQIQVLGDRPAQEGAGSLRMLGHEIEGRTDDRFAAGQARRTTGHRITPVRGEDAA